jgi:hypothetical protein
MMICWVFFVDIQLKNFSDSNVISVNNNVFGEPRLAVVVKDNRGNVYETHNLDELSEYRSKPFVIKNHSSVMVCDTLKYVGQNNNPNSQKITSFAVLYEGSNLAGELMTDWVKIK